MRVFSQFTHSQLQSLNEKYFLIQAHVFLEVQLAYVLDPLFGSEDEKGFERLLAFLFQRMEEDLKKGLPYKDDVRGLGDEKFLELFEAELPTEGVLQGQDAVLEGLGRFEFHFVQGRVIL